MEQARLLLAIGLSFLVLFIWSMFFTEQPPVDTNQETAGVEEQTNQAQDSNRQPEQPSPDRQPNPVAADPATASIKPDPAREITVDTPFYAVRISARGAAFTSFILT